MSKTGTFLFVLLEINILTNNVKLGGTIIMTTVFLLYNVKKIKTEQVDLLHNGSWLHYFRYYFKKSKPKNK